MIANVSAMDFTTPLSITTPKYYNQFRSIQLVLVKITNPYIFTISCLGLITNTSTIALLSKSFLTKNLRHKWTLIALALSDLMLNIALLIRVIRDVNKWQTQRLCEAISFLSHLAEILSAFFTVLFTIQRYVAVRYPFQVAIQKRSSPLIPLVVILILSVIFCLALRRSNDVDNHCLEDLTLGWFIADALCSFIVPFSLILLFNLLIVELIRKHSRSSITANSTLPRNVAHNKDTTRGKSGTNGERNSMTYSYAYSPTSNGPLPDDDIDRHLDSSNSLGKLAGSLPSIKKKESVVFHNGSDEVECLANDLLVNIPLVELGGGDGVASNQAPASPRHSKSSINDPKEPRQVSLKSNGSRDITYSTNESDSLTTKDGQTSQSIRVTRMLVLVSSCFLVLNAPAHICTTALKIYTTIDAPVFSQHAVLDRFQLSANLTDDQLQKYVFIAKTNGSFPTGNVVPMGGGDVADDQIFIHLLYIAIFFTQLISYASYSINFFLYSFSGVAFRTGLTQFFNKLRQR